MTRRRQQQTHKTAPTLPRFRYAAVFLVFTLALVSLSARAVYLQVIRADYLQQQGHSRHLRIVQDNAVRGMIMDRNGVPLAVSTPVDSVWAHPHTLAQHRDQWRALTAVLDMSVSELSTQLRRYSNREFMYIQRHITPEMADKVRALAVPGVALQREYRRYYPAGAMAGHLVGFTNIDDQGQEGLELLYDPLLQATPGRKRVFKDRLGNFVESVESLSLPVAGRDITTSIDRRIQYLAYRTLKDAMTKHNARAATAVVLDAQSGEILALVNQPGFNPNNRTTLASARFRNRAVTDVLEPGSTLKPFTVAAALEAGILRATSPINTAPGYFQIGARTISDTHNHGRLTVAGVIEKSSNVGAAKIALSMDKQALWNILHRAGIGQLTGSQLPGEVDGLLNPADKWVKVDQAAVSYGYGLSVTPLQLARAYTVLANDGVLVPLTALRSTSETRGQQVFSARTARQVRAMLERAVGVSGTGAAASVRHYRVAGKTGTVHKLVNGQYADDRYVALFAGMAPASRPRLVMVVTVDDPRGDAHFGGAVAAPVFREVMAGAMRLMNIAPDDIELPRQQLVRASKRDST